MPTTEPLDPGDDVEGQLKPIAGFGYNPAQAGAAAPAPVAAPAAPAPKPAPAPAAPARPAPAAPSRPGHARTSLGAPSLSLRHGQPAKTQTAPVADNAPAQPQKTAAFSQEAFMQAWHQYIIDNAASHLLVNIMRAHTPQRVGQSCTFAITVESTIQSELLEEARPQLLAHLRRALANDTVDLQVTADTSTSSPATWNEREVLADIIARHPDFAQTMHTLGLNLV